MPVEQYTVTVSGTYANDAGTQRKFFAGDEIAMSTAYEYGLPDATTPAAPGAFNETQDAYVDAGDAATLAAAVAADATGVNPKRFVEARTATAEPGGTTGLITDGTDFVVVTSGNAAHVITLPDASIGDVISLRNGATGYELRSHAPATVAINGGTASNAESAIAANIFVVCHRVNATAWICSQYATDGTESKVEAAA